MWLFYYISYLILVSGLSYVANTMNKEDQKIFTKFFDEVTQTSNNEEKQYLVDDFISEVKSNEYPIYENDRTVILLNQGNVKSVAVLGDMGDWVDKFYMHQIDNTNLFYFRGHYESDARLEYWLMIDENQIPIIDPLNKFIVRNGLGEISELAMPKYKRHSLFDNYIHGEIGRFNNLDEFSLSSRFLTYDKMIHIYLPPKYQESDKKYPVVYFQDGKDYIEFAVVPHLLDSMIKEKLIEPVIAVFVTPPNLYQPKEPNRSTEYGLNDEYVSFFVSELVSFVDNKFRTVIEPDARLVIGDSYGGLISLYIGFSNSEIFGKVYSQSGYHSFNNDKLINMINESETKELKVYFDCGIFEQQVGAAFIPKEERNFLEGNRRLKNVLETKGYDFIYFEYPEGHTWGNWRRHLIDALKYFFESG